jgi:F-type H+-transporting ATPase subunit a
VSVIPSRLRMPLLIVAAIGLTAVGSIFFKLQTPHVQLAAEKVLVGGVSIPNTMLATWLSMIILIALGWAGTRHMQQIPAGIQNLVEAVLETILGTIEGIADHKKSRDLYALIATIFLFIVISNWMGLLPGYGTIMARPAPEPEQAILSQEHQAPPIMTETKDGHAAPASDHAPTVAHSPEWAPLLRSASTDLNTTLGLAIISVIATQLFGFRYLGIRYLGRYINFSGRGFLIIINGFVGILEIISELAKFISLSFRLFGNIFAGEVLLAVITFLVPFVLVLPFFGLELFVGLLQGFVFAVLTLIFTVVATAEHGSHSESH